MASSSRAELFRGSQQAQHDLSDVVRRNEGAIAENEQIIARAIAIAAAAQMQQSLSAKIDEQDNRNANLVHRIRKIEKQNDKLCTVLLGLGLCIVATALGILVKHYYRFIKRTLDKGTLTSNRSLHRLENYPLPLTNPRSSATILPRASLFAL
jgi:hypothetical protein